jgi:lysophospholipid acyltransferase (LPLAT)-like uncharacterized protein
LSRHGQAPIMPLAYATSRYFQFKSWDKFKLPLPFSRGVFIYGMLFLLGKQLMKLKLKTGENWFKQLSVTYKTKLIVF